MGEEGILVPKQELVLKLCLAALYISSFVSVGLWMAGYVGTERVNYTRFEANNGDPYAEPPTMIQLDASPDQIYTDEPKRMEAADVQLAQQEEIALPEPEIEQEVQSEQEVHRELDIAYNLAAVEATLNWSQLTPIHVIATGYTAGIESTGKTPDHPQYGITYSGVQVRRDLYSTIAADPAIFPLGTILYIPRYGYGVVADVGSAITGNKIDLYFETVEDVYDFWGKQEVEVYLIQKGDGTVTEAMLDELNNSEVQEVFKLR